MQKHAGITRKHAMPQAALRLQNLSAAQLASRMYVLFPPAHQAQAASERRGVRASSFQHQPGEHAAAGRSFPTGNSRLPAPPNHRAAHIPRKTDPREARPTNVGTRYGRHEDGGCVRSDFEAAPDSMPRNAQRQVEDSSWERTPPRATPRSTQAAARVEALTGPRLSARIGAPKTTAPKPQ
jgi:hypothetical protein